MRLPLGDWPIHAMEFGALIDDPGDASLPLTERVSRPFSSGTAGRRFERWGRCRCPRGPDRRTIAAGAAGKNGSVSITCGVSMLGGLPAWKSRLAWISTQQDLANDFAAPEHLRPVAA